MINKYFGFFFLAAAAIGSTACGGSGDAADPNGTGTSEQSSTATAAPLTCTAGQVHARVCSGADSEDVSNDATSPCPAGMTPDATESAAVCCDPSSETEITACYRLPENCGADCATATEYGFAATMCDDDTWAAAHADVCSDAAVDAWTTANPSPYATP